MQADHLHLIVQADDRVSMSRGMAGFAISAARHIKAAVGELHGGARRRGSVFVARYHEHVLTVPREVRNALFYVLANWRHHGGDRELPGEAIDPCSSAIWFDGWREAPGPWPIRPGQALLPVHTPRSWLLREGWRRHPPPSMWATPGPLPSGAAW